MPAGTRRALLMGCLAATAGGVADAVGAPSYTFPGVSSLFWLWIGLGVAACRAEGDSVEAQTSRTPTLPPMSPGLWIGSLGAGALAALIVLGCGWLLRAEGRNVPRGQLVITSNSSGTVTPGALIQWVAVYKAPDGIERTTLPGTVWTVTEGHLDTIRPSFAFSNKRIRASGLLGVIPSQANLSPQESSRVTVTAQYWDNFSRPYVASSTITTRPARKASH